MGDTQRVKIGEKHEINKMTCVIHELMKENHCEKQMKVDVTR